jgi:hypothetical protein
MRQTPGATKMSRTPPQKSKAIIDGSTYVKPMDAPIVMHRRKVSRRLTAPRTVLSVAVEFRAG